MNRQAVVFALLSAALFGCSTPAAKALVASNAVEMPLKRADLPWLAGAIAAGGVAGPALLMIGLSRTDSATASLFLTLEGVATALLAWFAFRENFDRRIAVGMGCLVAGALILSWEGRPTLSGLVGPLAIAAACIAWGLDNNLTRKVSLADPLQIVELKGLIAGPVNLALGLWAGGELPAAPQMLIAGLVGFLGYGVSLVLFVFALRDLGTARTGAYFSTAPFVGTIAAILVLGEPVSIQLMAAGTLMALGLWLHLTEDHKHLHPHELMEHAHPHVHDEHHQHSHLPSDPPGQPHTHHHRHEPFRHTHSHVPDMHHAHRH